MLKTYEIWLRTYPTPDNPETRKYIEDAEYICGAVF